MFLEYFEYVENFNFYKINSLKIIILIQIITTFLNQKGKKISKKKPKIFTFEENIDQEKKYRPKDEKRKVTYLDNINSRINLQL